MNFITPYYPINTEGLNASNRIKQAQSLLLKKLENHQKSGKTKIQGRKHTAIYEEILNKIIKTEEFIYTTAPVTIYYRMMLKNLQSQSRLEIKLTKFGRIWSAGERKC